MRSNSKKTIAVIDGGGRAHALVKKYLQSKNVDKVIAIPGNDLILVEKNTKIFSKTKTTDVKKIVEICKQEKVDLVDVAQDDAVSVGLADALIKKGFKVFGPTRAAGQIEWDKAWARNFMIKFQIPHPLFEICKSEKQGIDFIEKQKNSNWYVKASGLAAGKGAIFAENNEQAVLAIKQMRNFGKAGKTYLIEKCLIGEEFSSFAIVNGRKFELIGHAQDHKKVFERDTGSNTGGMGCSSPPMVVTPNVEKQIKNIFKKTVEALAKIGRPYTGVLYLGGLIDKKGKVWTVEFNARWGDPEVEVLMPAIKNDLYQLVSHTLKGRIPEIKKDKLYRIVVTASSKGYPENYSKVVGKGIKGLEHLLKSNKIYGASVKKQNGKYVAAGGRLFYVLGEGKNVAQARKMAYNLLSQISVIGNNLHYRQDIGYRDVKRSLSQ